MKNSVEYASRLKRLCNRLQRSGVKAAEADDADVTAELVLGCLSMYTTEGKACAALNRLRSYFLDLNELRVSRVPEVMEVLGKNFEHGREAAERVLQVLRSVFDKQDRMDLDNLRGMGKREAKTFLGDLDGTCPYVVSWVMLRALGAHAFPMHEGMLTMLRGEEVVQPTADMATVQGFLERQIPTERIKKVYSLLRRHADNFKGAGHQGGKIAARKTGEKTGEKTTAEQKKPQQEG